jgi:hypothetical protein
MWDVVLGTPQGLIGAFFSVVSLLAGVLWAVSSPELGRVVWLKAGIGLFFWPLFLFFTLLALTTGFTLSRQYQPGTSLVDSLIMAFVGPLPLVLPVFNEHCEAQPGSWLCLLK